MAIVRATVVLNKKSGIRKDASRNVWHFSSLDTNTSTLSAIGEKLGAFYAGLAAILAPSVAAGATDHRVELAEVGFSSVSPVLWTQQFGTTAVTTTGTPMANEVAIALSFRGPIAGIPEESGLTRPRSRRRGRIFLGPIKASGVVSAVTPAFEPQVDAGTRELILDGYDTMQAAILAATPGSEVKHGVLSRVSGTLSIVEQVSVDDEFDVIRRRGQKPGFRMSRTVTPLTNPGARAGTDVALAS